MAASRRRAGFAALLAVPVCALAIWAIHRELSAFRYRDVVTALHALPVGYELAALALTALNFLVLTSYDVLALRYIGRSLSYRRTAFASFLSYAFSNALGFPLLTAAPIRYRLYTGWGLSAVEVRNMVAFYTAMFWLGLCAVGGIAFLLTPIALPPFLPLRAVSARPLGVLLLALAILYVGAVFVAKGPLRMRGVEIPVPARRIAVAQLVVASIDWVIAAGVLYLLLPGGADLSFPMFLAVFVLAQISGLISHVPGGLGVFEAVVLLFLPDTIPNSAVLASLLVYRFIFHLLPLLSAAVVLAIYEVRRPGAALQRMAGPVGRGISAVVPQVLALTTFVAGLLLLLSGATPAATDRLGWLGRGLPLGIVEASHFLGSVFGAGLLILAWGIQRRLDAAWHLAVTLLAAGIAVSLLKGLDWEEAVLLAVTLGTLIATRREFTRRASMISERFTAGWAAAVAVALVATAGLGLFAYKNVAYSSDLWWQFALNAEAPRFLRATVGALGVSLFFATARLLRHSRSEPAAVTPEDMAQVERIARDGPVTYANLVLLGDKSVLLGEGGNAFLMYAVEGRSWVSLGDPIGPEAERTELAWRFREMADARGGWTVFYQARPESLPIYLDLGLGLLKLGEEARVKLADFNMDGGGRAKFRQTLRKVERESCTFEIVPPEGVPPLLPRLREISDGWLAAKNTREKSFSLGRFDDHYLTRMPVAVVRKEDTVVAFANVLAAAEGQELSMDLMRYEEGAPPSVMEYLFLRLILWGKENGYAWFSLGMAPFSGFDDRPLSPLWNRLGSAVFRHGEHFYNFQGLREYKEKFDPVWEPRYLASPGGMAMPRILTNVASLISGGITGVVTK